MSFGEDSVFQSGFAECRITARVFCEALELIKKDGTALVEALGRLAGLWAFGISADRHRYHEVMMVCSILIFHTVNMCTDLPPSVASSPPIRHKIQEAARLFGFMVLAFEWPEHWKQPVISKLAAFFPEVIELWQSRHTPGWAAVQSRQLTQLPVVIPVQREPVPEPGEELYNRHRLLYSWVVRDCEIVVRSYKAALVSVADATI
mmetsp:Transcript_21108/g.45310  ORF Transcript_21108/g.45310 Transcript_21108/m.45310 type:complete len:205 (+) Transcript_21108:3-617(+)